ncbi:hypothetical protein KM043_006258 [Ampulex compressa]|nr:hypothetical protein KM043_006258 [Ampulex compressa]
MTGLIVRLFILCATFGCSLCAVEQERQNVHVGGRCERDYECIPHAFCRVQMNCFCDTSYAPSLDKAVCVATAGLTCMDDSACETMSNAECRQGVCACKETFILDTKNSSNCISRPTTIGDRCQRRDECEEAFDRAMCIDETCQCFTGHRFVNQTSKCVQIRGLYYSCSKDYECYLDDENANALQCKNGECVCREGEPRCSKGSQSAMIVTPMLLLLSLQWNF